MSKYRTELTKFLQSLSFEKKIVFGALICEKLYPNYLHFSEVTSGFAAHFGQLHHENLVSV